MNEVDHDRAAAPQVRPVLAGAAILLVLVLVVLAAAATGPWDRPLSDGGATGAPPLTPPSIELPTQTASQSIPPQDSADGSGGDTILRWVLYALGLAVAVVIALLVLRFLMVYLRRSKGPGVDARIAQPVTDIPEVDAPTMREGIAQARSILDSDRPPHDAIVLAWLALEHAAVSAGVGRTPAQTPTEFTAVVLDRTPAQRDAVDVLRELYSRVRFSDQPISDDDGDAARAAIAAIAAHWSAVETNA